MKIKSLKIVVLLFLIFSFLSCATTRTEVKDPNFLADMDGIYVGDLIALNKQNFFKPKVTEINVYFYPRSSSVAFFFRDGMNKVELTFSPEEFESLKESVKNYTEIYTNDSFEKKYKPSKKNRISKGYVNVAWGAASLGRNVDAIYDTNYEWVEVNNEVNPYFRLQSLSTKYPQEENVSSPTITLYFTPKEAASICTIINMDQIMKDIEDFNNAAYSFD